MKNIFNLVKTWFLSSNHWKHCIAGGAISIIMMIMMLPLTDLFWTIFITNMVVCMCMITAEYKDKQHGGLFDFQDIFAGMIIPILLFLLLI